MISTIKIACNCANPQLALHPFYSFVNSPSNIRILDVPRKIGKWQITEVYINVDYPDNTRHCAKCQLVSGTWVGTVGGSATSGKALMGYQIVANGIDENGSDVTGYILGKGDVVILDATQSFFDDGTRHYLNFLSSVPDTPMYGDVIVDTGDGIMKYWNGSSWEMLGSKTSLSGYATEIYVANKIDDAVNMISTDLSSKAEGESVTETISDHDTYVAGSKVVILDHDSKDWIYYTDGSNEYVPVLVDGVKRVVVNDSTYLVLDNITSIRLRLIKYVNGTSQGSAVYTFGKRDIETADKIRSVTESISAHCYTKAEIDGKGYATENWVEDKNYLTSHQSLSAYYTKTEVDNKHYLTAVPSGYATESWVEGKNYLTAHLPLTAYYTKTEVDNKNYLTAVPSEYAKTEDCDKKYLNWQSIKDGVEFNIYNEDGLVFFGDEDYDYVVFDLQKMRTERRSNLHPLLRWNNEDTVYLRSGGGTLATETMVDNAVSNSLSAYYTKTDIDNKNYLTSVPSQYSTKTDVSSIVWDDYLTVSGDVIPAHWEVIPSTYSVVIDEDYLIYPTDSTGELVGNTKAMDYRDKTYIWSESEAIEPITATYIEAKTTKKEKYTTSTYVDSQLSDYATKTYVDGLIGNINTILEGLK